MHLFQDPDLQPRVSLIMADLAQIEESSRLGPCMTLIGSMIRTMTDLTDLNQRWTTGCDTDITVVSWTAVGGRSVIRRWSVGEVPVVQACRDRVWTSV